MGRLVHGSIRAARCQVAGVCQLANCIDLAAGRGDREPGKAVPAHRLGQLVAAARRRPGDVGRYPVRGRRRREPVTSSVSRSTSSHLRRCRLGFVVGLESKRSSASRWQRCGPFQRRLGRRPVVGLTARLGVENREVKSVSRIGIARFRFVSDCLIGRATLAWTEEPSRSAHHRRTADTGVLRRLGGWFPRRHAQQLPRPNTRPVNPARLCCCSALSVGKTRFNDFRRSRKTACSRLALSA